MRVVFVQPFGISAHGGSSKVFRGLLAKPRAQVAILVYGMRPPQARGAEEELFVRERISMGRLERSRLADACRRTRSLTWNSSRRKVFAAMSRWSPDHVHLHLQGLGFIHAAEWCRTNRVAFSVSVHDDIRHLASIDPWKSFIEAMVGECWSEAVNRFVISPEIGEEYSRRYGVRSWIQITDGVESVAAVARPVRPNRLNTYFAGALNVPYEPNFIALQHALKAWSTNHPGDEVRLIARGGRSLRNEVIGAPKIEVKPFAAPAEVSRDLEDADFLYLPLSLDPKYSNFAKFSLSTKMITYLAAGVPIFYHGPPDAAAYRLLAKHDACVACFTNDPTDIMMAIDVPEARKIQVALNALNLGRKEFRLEDIQKRFWSSLLGNCESNN